jgi:hypothetical protein
MSRFEHDAARPALPRSKDLAAVPDPERSPTEGRDGLGRFASGNPWAPGARWQALIAEGLGRDLGGEAGKLGRRAYRLFRVYLADLPVDCASVRSLVQQRARAAVLADVYAARGAKLGFETAEGTAALGEAHKWCQRAERLAVTSLDVATKLAGPAGKRRKVIDLGQQLAEAAKPRAKP